MTSQQFEVGGVRVAVEGCGHGTLNAIYAAVETSCKARGWDGVDLLIIGGDFQATRNADDLTVMSVPPKYREMGDFHAYYSGARRAPYLTLFVAGNHEASAYLWELYYGGWVAPNIYYAGAANVLRLGGLRIAGLSGIWKGFDYRRPHYERLPFGPDEVKSFYHVRELDVRKLLQLRGQVDVGISHDWPRAVERHGDEARLFRMKPDFRQESHDGTLGNPAAQYVMDRLRPPYWFSAHLHCKFAAVKTYPPPPAEAPQGEASGSSEDAAGKSASASSVVAAPEDSHTVPVAAAQPSNPDEIDLDMDDDDDDDNGPPVAPAKKAEAEAKPESKKEPPSTAVDGVPDELLAQLPAAFSRPQPQAQQQKEKSIPGQPVPPTITNTVVRFLALDKCLPGRHFLQLVEINPFDASQGASAQDRPLDEEESPPVDKEASSSSPPEPRPRYRLQYDPEWLAITRVFARDLRIGGGDRDAPIPPDLGEAYYRPLIEAERAWVEENVVAAGKLDVPENFTVTAPPHIAGVDPENSSTQPREYTNPQTAAFCELIGVENLWDASEEERARRREAGPPAAPDFSFQRGGGGGGDGGGRGRGRGGGWGGGRGRGRGRGRGWGGRGR